MDEPGLDIHPNSTIIDAFDHAVAAMPEKTLIVAGDCRWSYREVADHVDTLARNLVKLGIRSGDVISVQLPNCAEFLLIYLAASRLNAITNPLLPVYRKKELSYILSFARTKLAFIPTTFRAFDYPALYRQLRAELPLLENIVSVGTHSSSNIRPFSDLLNSNCAAGTELPMQESKSKDVNVLIFTSGTEAAPKGVMHTHKSLMFSNLTMQTLLGLTHQEVIWAVSPVAHATGLEYCLRQAIVVGGTVVMQNVWDVEVALDLIERERCTFTTAATPFAAMLLDSPSLSTRELSHFRMFLCGGASIPSSLGSQMLDRTGCQLIPCWGMSECFAATVCSPDDPESKRWGSDGRAVPGTEAAIFDESRSHVLPPGETGEIGTRGPHLSKGYLNDPERTAATFSRGWLFSNDLGVMDKDGYLRVVGRKKDIINRGGLKISSSEVEHLLIEHRDVRQVAIVSVADEKLGERSCAFVVLAGTRTVTLDELRVFLKERGLASYKIPEYLCIIDSLPMTPTGKVQKFKLRGGLDAGRHVFLSD